MFPLLSRRSACRGRLEGFSVAEMLLVLVVIAVLIVIAVPGYQAVQGKAAAIKCVRNLNFIYLATLAFSEDHDGMIPPDIGPHVEVNPFFDKNQYWFKQAYLGPYVTHQPDRKRSSAGDLTEQEMEIFRCPARHSYDGPDERWVSPQAVRATYVMQKTYNKRKNYLFRTMPDKAKNLFLTEGRGATLSNANLKTAEVGSLNVENRLRRYHQRHSALHLLFFDGHIETYSGPDEGPRQYLRFWSGFDTE